MNDVTIRDYLDRLFVEHERRHTAHEAAHQREHSASQRALEDAAKLTKENKADANEWREAMNDREARYITKSEVILLLTAVSLVVGIVSTIVSVVIVANRAPL